jgi:hypothetical protein
MQRWHCRLSLEPLECRLGWVTNIKFDLSVCKPSKNFLSLILRFASIPISCPTIRNSISRRYFKPDVLYISDRIGVHLPYVKMCWQGLCGEAGTFDDKLVR